MRHYRLGQLVGILFGACLLAGAASPTVTAGGAKKTLATTATTTATPPVKVLPIEIIPLDGFNLAVEDQINPHYVVVKLTSPAHNWFAGKIDQLATDGIATTIGLLMEGNDTAGNKADVSKWVGLMPLYSYADPNKYESYECFQKDDKGRWLSTDPFKDEKSIFAGTGKTPKQSAIPEKVAEQFLSKDGKSWEPWKEVDSAEAVKELNIFRIRQKFDLPTAVVAMRVPYLPSIEAEFIKRLETAKIPGVTIHHIGYSQGNRPLSVIQVDDFDTNVKTKDHPVILLYGSEDGDEPDGAWLTHGAICKLISGKSNTKALRNDVTILCIPSLDPDGAAKCSYAEITYSFSYKGNSVRPEALAYTKFLSTWINDGHRLDIINDIHNIECNEGPNILSPIVDLRQVGIITDIQSFVLARFRDIKTSPTVWLHGMISDRLTSWCYLHFGTIQMTYEVNSRFPDNRLSLDQLKRTGGVLVTSLGEYTTVKMFKSYEQGMLSMQSKYVDNRKRYWEQCDDPDHQRSEYEIVGLGY